MTRRAFVAGLATLPLAGCAGSGSRQPSALTGHVTGETTLGELAAHPAFGGHGRLLLPWYGERENEREALSGVGRHMVYHDHFVLDDMLAPLNRLIDDAGQGRQVAYPVYSEEQRAADPSLADVVLWHFAGNEGAPFAIVSAGGAFAYAGSLHESLPHALALSEKGYHAFSLSYRLGSGQLASQDLAAAVAWVHGHAEELGISTDGYSLWGSSAGARMASAVGTYGTAALGAAPCPQACTVVMAYTGQSAWTPDDPPTFSVVGTEDGIASARVMQRRIEELDAAGVPAEIRVCPGVGHGFGLGTGTSAEGWIDDASAFWERRGLARSEQ